LGVITDYDVWVKNYTSKKGFFPLLDLEKITALSEEQLAFVRLDPTQITLPEILRKYPNVTYVLSTSHDNKVHLYRYINFIFAKYNINNPIILMFQSDEKDSETFQINVSSEAGALLIDGFGDGVWIKAEQPQTLINSTAFGILQATRTRISKTEYISCPSCGRTLFDLQETTAKIRKETSHLKGIKIGIMGCIVNGPGEMADADYGYVGTGPGKINLYKEKTVVKKNVPEAEAVHELIELIRDNGDWVEPKE
jgi:(E)-4-hydroxy-3-methylbut-2-enyl-diphosphate synthase